MKRVFQGTPMRSFAWTHAIRMLTSTSIELCKDSILMS